MKTKIAWGILFFLITTAVPTGATVNNLSFPTRTKVEQALQEAVESWGPLVCREGEISAVVADRISLREVGRGESMFFLGAAEVFVNGQPGNSTALRPIAPGFNFAARLHFDQEGVLRLVDGWYVGTEVKVLAVDPERNLLTVQPLDHTRTGRLAFSPHFTATSPLPAPGETCFLLFDWEHRVRQIISAP